MANAVVRRECKSQSRAIDGHLRRRDQLRDELMRGLTEKEIAARLGLSHHTVHAYAKQIYREHGVSGRISFMAWMFQSLSKKHDSLDASVDYQASRAGTPGPTHEMHVSCQYDNDRDLVLREAKEHLQRAIRCLNHQSCRAA